MIKKRWAVAVIAAMLVLAAGCGKSAPEPGKTTVSAPAAGGNTSPGTGNSNAGKTTTTVSAVGTPKEKENPVFEKVNLGPLKVTEAAKIGPLSVTVKEMAVVQKATGLPPNYNYVLLNLTIVNQGKDDYTINTTDHFKMETPEAKTMPVSVQATAQKSPRLQGTIQGGQSSSGWLGYLVKAQDGVFKYRFIHPDWGEARWEFPIR